MPGFKQVPAGLSYSGIIERRLSREQRNISTSEAKTKTREETEAIDISLESVARLFRNFKRIKRELRFRLKYDPSHDK